MDTTERKIQETTPGIPEEAILASLAKNQFHISFAGTVLRWGQHVTFIIAGSEGEQTLEELNTHLQIADLGSEQFTEVEARFYEEPYEVKGFGIGRIEYSGENPVIIAVYPTQQIADAIAEHVQEHGLKKHAHWPNGDHVDINEVEVPCPSADLYLHEIIPFEVMPENEVRRMLELRPLTKWQLRRRTMGRTVRHMLENHHH